MFDRTLWVTTDEQNQVEVTLHQQFEGQESCVVWDAAIVAAFFLQKHSQWVKNKTVVELGSGTGALGIVAAVLG